MGVRRRIHQSGITFLGLLFMAALIASTVAIVLQVFPTVLEYYAVQKAADKAALGQTVAEVRSLFDKQATLDDVKSINGNGIDITKEGDKVVVNFSYQREIHLLGPAYLTLKYAGRSK